MGTFLGLAANGWIGVLGALNICLQTSGAIQTKESERDLERAAADYEVAQTLQELPAEILQARQELEDRHRELISLALEMEEALATQRHENAQQEVLLREMESLRQQSAESEGGLADRYYADPIHFLRAQNDMILADAAFRRARRWVFFTLRALEFKWNKDFIFSDEDGKDWEFSSIFKLENFDELEKLVAAMEDFNFNNGIGFTREPCVDRISLRDEMFAPFAGAGVDDRLRLDVKTGQIVTATNLFRRKLRDSLDADGNLVLKLDTFALRKKSGRLFLGPRYGSNGSLTDAGLYLDKLDWIKINVVGRHPQELLSGRLSYSGTCYIRTRVPPCAQPATDPFSLKGEYRIFPFSYFRTLDNGVTWQTLKEQAANVGVAYINTPGTAPLNCEDSSPAFGVQNTFLKERSVAATDWTLTLFAGEFNIDQIDDIEIYVRHLYATRDEPICP